MGGASNQRGSLKEDGKRKTLIEKSRKRQLNLLVYMLRKECEWMAKHFQTEKKLLRATGNGKLWRAILKKKCLLGRCYFTFIKKNSLFVRYTLFFLWNLIL